MGLNVNRSTPVHPLDVGPRLMSRGNHRTPGGYALEEERSVMTTGPDGGAQPGGSGRRVASLPGNEPGPQPAEIEFRDLRYFVVVAEELHFGRAAARLYITQPGLSHAIARMERQLDVQLLRRTRSSVELTEAGAELLRCGRRLLADLDGAVTRVRMAGRGEAGLVRIGVAQLAEPLVPPALAASSPSTSTGGPSGTASPSS
jgi:hypothetical protein